MGSALKIRDDLTPLELRRWARVESYGRAAARAYGIANALEEMPRADAARLAGMDRQTLRDAVVRYNAKGLEGLHDRPKGYSPRRLTADEEAALAAVIIAGPEPERDGVCAWTRAASNRLPVGLHLLRRAPGHRRRRHPGDAERQRQGHGPVSRTLRRYPGPGCARRHDVRRRRLARRARPHRPRQRHLGAVAALQSRTQPRERVWLYLRERFLSLRVLDDTEAIIDACRQAWIDLIAELDRMRTLCAYPWIMKVIS